METNKKKVAVGAVIMAAVLLLCVYLVQLLFMSTSGDRSVPPVMAIGILILSGVAVPVVPGIFYIINKFGRWYSKPEIGLFGIITYALFIICMLVVFPFVEVPYSLLPKGEMAAGYAGFLIQLFTIVPAVICVLISLVYMLSKKNKL